MIFDEELKIPWKIKGREFRYMFLINPPKNIKMSMAVRYFLDFPQKQYLFGVKASFALVLTDKAIANDGEIGDDFHRKTDHSPP